LLSAFFSKASDNFYGMIDGGDGDDVLDRYIRASSSVSLQASIAYRLTF